VNLIKGGKLRALAVTGTRRSEVLPDVPTMQEAGVPKFDLVSWYAVMAPYKTPAPVVEKLNKAIEKMLREPATKERFASQSAKPLIMGADQSERFFLKELKTWGEVVKTSGAKVD
jgi:tripartite-type tricarboxylate transporter receptor subunit TctC